MIESQLDLVTFFRCVYLSSKVVDKAASKKISNDQKGKWLKSTPLSALPITPKLIIKLVPLPLSFDGNSSGMYTPNTIMIAVSISLMHPSTTVCTQDYWENIKNNSNPISETIRHLKANFLFMDWRILVKRRLAKTYVQPTTIVLIYRETPKVSKVNWVR